MTWRTLFQNPVAVMPVSTWMKQRKYLEGVEELFAYDGEGQRFKVGERLWLNVDSPEPEFLEVFPIPGGERIRLFSAYLPNAYEFNTTQAQDLKALRAAVNVFMQPDERDEQLLLKRLKRILQYVKQMPSRGASHTPEMG